MRVRVYVCSSRATHPYSYGTANPIYYFFERKILFLRPKCNRILVTRINILFTLTLTFLANVCCTHYISEKPNMITHKNENPIACRVRSILLNFVQITCHSCGLFSIMWHYFTVYLMCIESHYCYYFLLLLIWWHPDHTINMAACNL